MQQKLFFDDEFEALNLMLSHGRKSTKELAALLFPHLKIETAYARLKNCLNPDKDEKLSFGQIIAAMKFCDSYEPLLFACDETLHARPDRKAPGDEEVRIVQAINGAADTMKSAMRQLENLRMRADMQP